MKIGDLVSWRSQIKDSRLGVVISEVFDFRPEWPDEYPAVEVLTVHGSTQEEGVYIWQLEHIESVSEA